MEKQQKMINANGVFDTGFLCGKSLYLFCFEQIPNAHFINGIDGEKAYEAIKSAFADLVKSEHVYRYYDKSKKKYVFDQTYLIMHNGCILEFDNYYCEIYHNGQQADFINAPH